MDQTEVIQRLKALLHEVDESPMPESESSIQANIHQLVGVDLQDDSPFEWRAEYMAFSFRENCTDEDSDWGTYFGPMAMCRRDDGSVFETPSIKMVDEQILGYWLDRAEESNNPLLKARYYGLVWDFSKTVTRIPPSHEIAIACITNLLLIAKTDRHKYETDVVEKLGRALSLALSLGSSDLVGKCKAAILEYERRIAADEGRGPWGFSFDLLLADRLADRKVGLSQTEEEGIVSDLEARLQGLSYSLEDGNPDPHAIEPVVRRLAKYYQAKERTDDVRRVIGELRVACGKLAEAAAPLMVSVLFQRLYGMYREFHLYAEADAIAVQMRELGAGINADLKEFTHTLRIPREEFDAYLESMTEGVST